MSDPIIIVGAGHAAGQAVASLRQQGYDGALIVIGEESFIPYQRPPLSKKFLAGELPIERVYFKPLEFYADNDVEVMLDCRVARIDRPSKTVHLADGRTLRYSKLLLTTGSRVRKLDNPGAGLPGIFYLRTIADVEAIRSHFKDGAKLVVVGGGYIGLEVAAVAVKHGISVTVLEMAPRLMARVVDERVSAFYRDVHESEGVDIRTGVTVSAFEGEGTVERVVAADGETFDADFVVVGVGILPNVELAEDAGLKVDNGIVVDEYCQTEDPDIYAAGDCTSHPNALLDRRLRLESVHNALEQAKTAAAAMCGKLTAYAQVPWFWSDQYDLKLQIVGLSSGHDNVVLRGTPDPKTRSFAAFYMKDGVIIAVDAVNRAAEYMMSRQLIANKVKVDPARLSDESINMKEIAK